MSIWVYDFIKDKIIEVICRLKGVSAASRSPYGVPDRLVDRAPCDSGRLRVQGSVLSTVVSDGSGGYGEVSTEIG